MKTHYCPVDKTTISYEGECNWCGEKELSMKEEALKLADDLQKHFNCYNEYSDMIRKLVAELEDLKHDNEELLKSLTAERKQGEPVAWLYDNGKWTAETDQEKVWVESSDFTHDVRMYIDGDFEDLPQKFAYANEIAKRLNTAPRELSDEEIEQIAVKWYVGTRILPIGFARAILKKASEK